MKTNIRNKLILFNIFVFVFPVLFTSCSRDESELREIAAVIGIAVDKTSGKQPITVTLEIAGTKAAKGSSDSAEKGKGTIIEVSRGKNFFEAVENFSKSSPALIDFSHTKTIVLSKDFAESGIPEILDYVSRDRQLRITSWLFIANKTAREVFESKLPNEDIISMGLNNMMNQYKKDASILPVTVNDFIIEAESESKTSIAPIIDIEKSKDTPEGKIKIERMAVFKNKNLIGSLTNEESKSLIWLLDSRKGHMTILPFESDEGNGNATLEIYKKSSKIIPHITNGIVHLQIECNGYALIRELQNIDLTPEIIKKLEDNSEFILKRRINKLIDKSQKDFNADLAGFSKKIFNNNPATWLTMKKDWNEIYPNVSYEISCNIRCTKIGLIKGIEK